MADYIHTHLYGECCDDSQVSFAAFYRVSHPTSLRQYSFHSHHLRRGKDCRPWRAHGRGHGDNGAEALGSGAIAKALAIGRRGRWLLGGGAWANGTGATSARAREERTMVMATKALTLMWIGGTIMNMLRLV